MAPKFTYRPVWALQESYKPRPTPWWQIYMAFAVFIVALLVINTVGLSLQAQQLADSGTVIVFFGFVQHWLQRHINTQY